MFFSYAFFSVASAYYSMFSTAFFLTALKQDLIPYNHSARTLVICNR